MKWVKENLATLLTTSVGLGLSLYLYWLSLKAPGLSFLDRSPHLQIVNFSKLPDSPIRLVGADGNLIEKNIFVSEFFVWNSGDLPIKPENVLKPLQITFPDSVEIIESKVVASSRPDITEFKFSRKDPKSISLSFRILEPEDGISIQIVYSADEAAEAKLDGAIEGVRDLGETISSVNFAAARRMTVMVLLVIFAIAAIILIGLVFEKYIGPFVRRISAAIPIKTQEACVLIFLVLLLTTFGAGWMYIMFNTAKSSIRSKGETVVPAYLLEPKHP